MAYAFNGTSQYLRLGSAPASAAPMTIAAQVRATAFGAVRSVGAVGQTPAAVRHRNQVTFTGTGLARAVAIGSAQGISETMVAATVGQWCHAAGVFASLSSRTAYLNGVAATQNTTAISQSAFTETGIGAQQGSVAGQYENAWAGDIAEFGIWSVALSADEIGSLAKGIACNRIRPQSLVFYAPLIRGLIDVCGGVTITNVSGATVATHPRIYA